MVVHVILTAIIVSSATSGILSWYLKLVSQYNQKHRSYQEPARVLQNDVKVTDLLILESIQGSCPSSQGPLVPPLPTAKDCAASENSTFLRSVLKALAFLKN